MTNDIQTMPAKISEFGRLLFDRNLTDAAVSYIYARVGDCSLIMPRYINPHIFLQANALFSLAPQMLRLSSNRTSLIKESTAEHRSSGA
ncbi:MAG: hypothetical protein Q7J07_06815 [Pelolinea sp.]|nr:hypothetical protein [Pelolinea sp.]